MGSARSSQAYTSPMSTARWTASDSEEDPGNINAAQCPERANEGDLDLPLEAQKEVVLEKAPPKAQVVPKLAVCELTPSTALTSPRQIPLMDLRAVGHCDVCRCTLLVGPNWYHKLGSDDDLCEKHWQELNEADQASFTNISAIAILGDERSDYEAEEERAPLASSPGISTPRSRAYS